MKDHKVVMMVYETYDYKYFKPLENNRGRVHTDGVNERRVYYLQSLRDAKEWVPQRSLVEINESGWILDGLHNYTDRKRNKNPIWYVVNTDPRYNAKRGKYDVLDEVMKGNRINTTWSNSEIFNCALFSGESPLAKTINKLVEATENRCLWFEVLAVIAKKEHFFYGRKKDFTLALFKNEELLSNSRSTEFKYEIEWFVKFCNHLEGQNRKNLLAFIYGVIWHENNDVINKKKWRAAVLQIPPEFLASHNSMNDINIIRKKLISIYNNIAAEKVNADALVYTARAADVIERKKVIRSN